jgi:hypothetical protein
LDEHSESEQLVERLGVVGGVEVGPVEVPADQPLDIEGGEGDEDRDDRRQVEGRGPVAQLGYGATTSGARTAPAAETGSATG